LTRRLGRPGVLPVLNILALCGMYAALFTTAHVSTQYRAAIVAGGVLVALIAFVTFNDRLRHQLGSTAFGPSSRRLLALLPWVALVLIVASRGLWWTQRAASLRLFSLYVLANWSVALIRTDVPAERSWFTGPRRAAVWLAALLAALGLDGAALGVNPFGCAVSTALAAIAVVAFAIACRGSRAANLKLLTVSFATAIAVVAVEAAIRILHIGQNVQEVDSREYARQFYSLTPPRSAFVNAPKALDEFGPALISINSRGIRGPELPDDRADLLLIGDSMIEARQLPWEVTLGPRLQEAVRARGIDARVVAHGMRGWSPLLEWNWYRKVGRQLHPQTVMLFFFWNDLWTTGDEASAFAARLSADGRPDWFDVPVDSNWIWYKHVRTVRVIADVWRRLTFDELRRAFTSVRTAKASGAVDDAEADRMARTLTERPLTETELRTLLTAPEPELPADLRSLAATSLWPSLRPWDRWTERQRAAAARTELELQRFAEDVRGDGGRFVIVYVPNPLQIGAEECRVGRLFERVDTNVVLPPDSGIQTWLRGAAQRHGIELLDPSAAMREFEQRRPAGDTAPLYLRADCHWAERGHAFMANYIADWYQQHLPAELPARSSMVK